MHFNAFFIVLLIDFMHTPVKYAVACEHYRENTWVQVNAIHSSTGWRMGRSRQAGRATRKRRHKQDSLTQSGMMVGFAAVSNVFILASDVACPFLQPLCVTSRSTWGWWSFSTDGDSRLGCCSQHTSRVQHRQHNLCIYFVKIKQHSFSWEKSVCVCWALSSRHW